MTSPKGDPTYIKNKDHYFIDVAIAISKASTHPNCPGGCIIVRDREIIGDGRSLLTDSKVEIDCISYAIAAAARNGTPAIGAVIYTTRYPFSMSVFQAHMMGIHKIVFLGHEWEPFYKDEFRRAARIARELKMSIEPIYTDDDQRFTTNTYDRNTDQAIQSGKNPYAPDEYDPSDSKNIHDENTTTIRS